MKNGLLIWNVALTLIAGFLLFKQFGGSKASGSKAAKLDTAAAANPVSIAYFEMDSVASQFELVKTLKAELSKKETNIQTEVNRLAQAIQNKYAEYQNMEKEGKLTQELAQKGGEEIKQMEESLKNRRMQMEQEYNDFMAKRQTDIKSKIEEYIKEFNQQKKYTYVLSDDPGLFYFRDTTFNITKEIIKGLNERHKAVK